MADTPDPWKRWERTRRGGRKRFMWLYGFFGWGITCGILASGLLGMGLVFDRPRPGATIVALLPVVLFPPAGLLWGAIMWSWMENQYLAASEKARIVYKVERLQDEVDELRKRLPPPKDTNITERGP